MDQRNASVMDDAPELSILVLSRNGAKLLERLFESIVRHNSFKRFEIIVVDHASTDGTADVLTAWERRLPLRTVMRDQNFSYANSNNKAARFARGSNLLLLNNDVIFVQDVIPQMLRVLREDDIGAVGIKQVGKLGVGDDAPYVDHIGVCFGWEVKDSPLRAYHVRPNAGNWVRSSSLGEYPAVSASMMLCRRDDYFAVGGLDEGYTYGYEDLDFCLKITHRLKKRVVCLNSKYVVHEKNTTRVRDRASLDQYRDSNAKRFQRRWSRRLRRGLLKGLLDGDVGFADRSLRLAIAAGPTEAHNAYGLGAAAQRLFGWSVTYLGPDGWGAVPGIDLFVSLSPAVEVGRLQHAEPQLVRIGWITDPVAWLTGSRLHDYDVLFCDGLEDRRFLRELQAVRCAPMPSRETASPGRSSAPFFDRCARRLRRTLSALAGRPQMAIKLPDPRKAPHSHAVARELAKRLRLLGERVRMDGHTEWGMPARWADEVSICVGTAPYTSDFPNQVNIFWLLGPAQQDLDGIEKYQLVLADDPAAAEALRARGLRVERLPAPEKDPQMLARAQVIRDLATRLARLRDPDEAETAVKAPAELLEVASTS
jgi:GT2 family glycosyltransferase